MVIPCPDIITSGGSCQFTGCHVPLKQSIQRHFSDRAVGQNVIFHVLCNLLFLFPEFRQVLRIYSPAFSSPFVCVTVTVSAIVPVTLSIPQFSALRVFSAYCHENLSFRNLPFRSHGMGLSVSIILHPHAI